MAIASPLDCELRDLPYGKVYGIWERQVGQWVAC